jgi:CRISPR-associated endonuclease/helicase Cas3
VGANIDLDALVTESAPFASLVQRLDRLNRSGRPEPAPALVVQDSTVRADDPVYGAARLATWQWLAEQTDPIRYTSRLDAAKLTGGLPASPLALRSLARTAPESLTPRGPYLPILDEATVDAWVRTSPAPVPDPPIACHLHGLVDERPTVNVVWRAHLDATAPETWAEAVDVVPPAVEEMVEVPLPAVRRWLDAAAADPKLSDRESEPDHDTGVEPSSKPFRVRDRAGRPQVLVYRGPRDAVNRGRGDASEVVTSDRIQPRDLVVVPVKYGGCDRYGWHPVSTEPVVDVADLRTVVSRHHPELADSPELAELLDTVAEDAGDATVRPEAYQKLLSGDWVPSGDLPFGRNLSRLAAARAVRATLTSDGPWPVVLSIAGTQLADDHSEAGSSVGRTRIPLDGHQSAVEKRARQFARGLGLPPELIEAVGIAARHHDEGKRDPRAQVMLWGGDRLSAEVADEPIAKSGMDPVDRRAFRQAQERAGYPPGMRHEALSARIVAALLGGRSDVDRDLGGASGRVTSRPGPAAAAAGG